MATHLEDLLTVKEASELTFYSERHIRLLCDMGRIDARLMNFRLKRWVISKRSLLRYLAKNRLDRPNLSPLHLRERNSANASKP